MYEVDIAVIGTVITTPVKRELSSGHQVVTFRMVSNSRRLDHASGEWVENGRLYFTVNCWRRLVRGVDASVNQGDPVIVYGQLRSHEYQARDGSERSDLELRATAIGPDLARCTAPVVRKHTFRNPAGRSGGERSTAVVSGGQRNSAPEERTAAAHPAVTESVGT